MTHSSSTNPLRRLVLAAALSSTLFGAGPASAAGDIAFTTDQTYPEGLAWSPTQKLFFVSAIRDGSIGTLSMSGQYRTFVRDERLVSTVGLQIDAKRQWIWAAVSDLGNSKRSSPATQGKLAAIAAFDLATGAPRAYHDLGGLVSGAHFANDLAIDPAGNVYVTDSFAPLIYRVDAQGQASVFARSPLFEGEGFNLNGIVYHPDGYLLVGKHNSGELFRVSIADPSKIERVRLSEALKGADGIVLRDGKHLSVVQNSGADRVVELRSTDGWQSAAITTTRPARQSFPTSGALVGKQLYVVNSRLDTLLSQDAEKVGNYVLQKH